MGLEPEGRDPENEAKNFSFPPEKTEINEEKDEVTAEKIDWPNDLPAELVKLLPQELQNSDKLKTR